MVSFAHLARELRYQIWTYVFDEALGSTLGQNKPSFVDLRRGSLIRFNHTHSKLLAYMKVKASNEVLTAEVRGFSFFVYHVCFDIPGFLRFINTKHSATYLTSLSFIMPPLSLMSSAAV